LPKRVVVGPRRPTVLSGGRKRNPELGPGDVPLGDRAFCSFTHLALLTARGVQAVFRVHQRIVVDFTVGRPHAEPRRLKSSNSKGLPRSRWLRRLGDEDQLVAWLKPVERPEWLSAEACAALPDTLQVRELRYRVGRPGFRVREVTLVTTLVDVEAYSKAELQAAYGLQWTIETTFAPTISRCAESADRMKRPSAKS